jgi:hypothetical protein
MVHQNGIIKGNQLMYNGGLEKRVYFISLTQSMLNQVPKFKQQLILYHSAPFAIW